MTEREQSLPLARRSVITGAGLGLGAALTSRLAQAQIAPDSLPQAAVQKDFWTAEYWAKKGDVSLYLWRKRASEPQPGERPLPTLFLVHGSSNSSRTSFDLHVPKRDEYSMMNVFARAGYDVWTMDHENYGRSSRTQSNSDIASGVEDLKAAAEVVAGATGREKFHMFGTSSGALRAAASPWRIRTVSTGWCCPPSPTPAPARRPWQNAPSSLRFTAPTTGASATVR